jgi:gluconolactonase
MKKFIVFNSALTLALSFLIQVTLNAQIMDKNSIAAPGAQVEKLGGGYKFTEGPVADAAGNVFFSDQPNDKIIRWDAETGAFSTFSEKSGRANGMYFDKNGNLVSCSDEDNQVWSFDKKGNHTVLVKDYDPRDYWKRDEAMQQDGEHVYYLHPTSKKLIRVDDQMKKPNGIIGTADGKKLYIADIGANKTYLYDVNADGSLSNKTLFVSKGSDGMILDEEGNLYITGVGVTVFDKKGEQIAHFPVHKGWTANLCFGGKNHDLLFITAETAVYGIKMRVKGIK